MADDDDEGESPSDQYWQQIHDDIEAQPDVFIDGREAYDALEADGAYAWLSEVDAGDASIELAATLYAFGIDDPREIVSEGDNGIFQEGGQWVLYVEHSEGGFARIELGDADGPLPEWVWDDWYEFADLHDIDWDIENSLGGD